VEWNNKTEFYDRDLNNFRLLNVLNVLSVGVIITRVSELQRLFDDLGKGASYGASTTHWDKLIPKVDAGGCPHDILLQFRKAPMNKIFVTVSGGCAYAVEGTVPQGFALEIIDFDNIEAGDSFPSAEAHEYCMKHNLYDPPRPARR
jgi:restriction endonuclease BglII